MDIGQPFRIEFRLLDCEIELLQPQQTIAYLSVLRELKQLVSAAVQDLGVNYTTLDRVEAVIANADFTKQLREDEDFNKVRETKILIFDQRHPTSTEYFTLQELLQIAKVLRRHLEQHLQYSIGCRLVLDVEAEDD